MCLFPDMLLSPLHPPPPPTPVCLALGQPFGSDTSPTSMDIPGGDVATAASAGIRKAKSFGYVYIRGGVGQACVDVGILIA